MLFLLLSQARRLSSCLYVLSTNGAFSISSAGAVQAVGDKCLLVIGRPARPSSNIYAGYPECELIGSSPIRLRRGRGVDISTSLFLWPAGPVPFVALASGLENLFFEVRLSAGFPS